MKMNEEFLASMHEAMKALQTAGPLEATALIQRALGRQSGNAFQTKVAPAQVVQNLLENNTVEATTVLETSRPGASRTEYAAKARGTEVGHFSAGRFACAAGSRHYKLYIPATSASRPMPLVVMLHGCTQNADDFAAGTRMNALADEMGFAVLYPIQPAEANHSKCWNWFRPGDQAANAGEPAIIAGMTRDVIAANCIDPDRVYVAGMSAGGAMAAVVAQCYPELFAAVGVHSGLPVGCAHDLPSALGAMKGGAGIPGRRKATEPTGATPQRPIIVFHGDADATVHRVNGDRLIAPYAQHQVRTQVERGTTPADRSFTRTLITTASGVDAEYWTIHGAGHAWSGGDAAGSYTDVKGPVASEAMLRFFLAHPRK